ncbi:MAG: hypothetical protein AB2810_13645 [Candidatus Thiodiazotropha endolucinida]
MIDWLKETSVLAVSRLMKLSWNAIDEIMCRVVERVCLVDKRSLWSTWVLMKRPPGNAMTK